MTEEAVTAEDRLALAEDYDKARLDENDSAGNANKDERSDLKLGDDRTITAGGAVVSGTGAPGGLTTQFPGAEDVNNGGAAARTAKGLNTDGVTLEDKTWTAQSATTFVADNAANVPGQTFTVDQLPDPRVVNNSGLPAHVIPDGLVVEGGRTDDINASQENGGDVATAPRHTNSPYGGLESPTAQADGTTAATAPGVGGRAAGRKAAKSE